LLASAPVSSAGSFDGAVAKIIGFIDTLASEPRKLVKCARDPLRLPVAFSRTASVLAEDGDIVTDVRKLRCELVFAESGEPRQLLPESVDDSEGIHRDGPSVGVIDRVQQPPEGDVHRLPRR
jgi:hypothetical protein